MARRGAWRFRRRFIVLGVLALACGVGAIMDAVSLMRPMPQAIYAPVETAKVVVAKENVGRYQLLTDEVLTVVERPKDSIPDGAITRIEDAEGRLLLQAACNGEVIVEKKLAGEVRWQVGIEAKIPGLCHSQRDSGSQN
jgi:Flp pilus assembly protein CpaB